MGGEPGRTQLSGGPGPQEVGGRQEVPRGPEVAQCLTGAQSPCGELEGGGERMESDVCRLERGCGSSLGLEGEAEEQSDRQRKGRGVDDGCRGGTDGALTCY